jgi:hypothetical protein
MDSFKWGKAWSYAYGFLAGRTLMHAIVLVGIGILIPFGAQFALAGGPVARPNPMMMEGGLETAAAMGWMLLALLLLTYVLQTGSYFASWRLGLGQSTLGGALGYGLPAGLLAVLVLAALGFLIGGTAALAGTEGAAILLVVALLIPLLAAMAAYYTTIAAAAAVGFALMLSLTMVLGAATGQVGMAATMVGGSGVVAVVILVLCGITLWFAARLSCVTALLAERRSFNLIAAFKASWELTWEEQWSIMRYLALIGLGIALLVIALGVAIGASAGMYLTPANATAATTGAALVGLAFSVPMAFLTVMIPAGIYRALTPPVIDAEVFA